MSIELHWSAIETFDTELVTETVRSTTIRPKTCRVNPPELRWTNTIEQTEGVEYQELPDLLRESDFVTLHTSLSEETFHLISEKELSLMKPSSYLINTSRGPVIDEKALYRALRDKWIVVHTVGYGLREGVVVGKSSPETHWI
jgi:hypothetical protein